MSATDEMGLTHAAAQGYEQFFLPAIFHQWPAKIIASVEITDHDNVLDVGCGTGALTREIANGRLDKSGITGFDLSESMLGVARQVCPGVNFLQGNAAHLPFDDSSFDAVVSAFMLMFAPQPGQVINEMRRVLRPGGRMAVSIWQGLSNNPVYQALVDATREVLDEASANSIAWPFSMGEVSVLSDAFNIDGLSDVSIKPYDGYAVFPSLAELVTIEIQAWLLAGSVSAEQIASITAALRGNYPDFANSDGPIRFPLNAFIISGEAA